MKQFRYQLNFFGRYILVFVWGWSCVVSGPCNSSDRALEKCVFLFVTPPSQKKGAPDNGTGACVLPVLAVLLSRFLVDIVHKTQTEQLLELTISQAGAIIGLRPLLIH